MINISIVRSTKIPKRKPSSSTINMGDPVGVAIVSSLVKLLLNDLGKPAFQELGRLIGVKRELAALTTSLSSINAVLLDAEEQQQHVMLQHSVRVWLLSLKDVACDIEDVLDLISTQDLKKRVKGNEKSLSFNKFTRFITRYKLALKLKAICCRLDEIAAYRFKYNFQEQHHKPNLDFGRERETYSFVQNSHVFGREEDKEWIVSHLVNSCSSQQSNEIPVLPILGIGGMGKTTLAKLVANDPRIRAIEHFELRLWAYVPNKFDLKVVINNIVQSNNGESCSGLNLEAMKDRLHRFLTERTFFLVLDNVWIEDPKVWCELKELLDVGSKRSRIIVTTREERVASITGTMEAFKLKPLSDNSCWSIFAKCAFGEGEEEKYPSLVQIGNDIVGKCCGIPLAAKTLGSQLRIARDHSTWKRIEESELWKIKQAPTDIFPALKLSFDQLPHHLRPCFSFCSTFIKGEFISRKDLILLWMALGLLQSDETTNEETGNRYFDELVSRSFFEPVNTFTYMVQQLSWCNDTSETDMAVTLNGIDPTLSFEPSNNQIRGVQMHDLVHDLASSISADETGYVNCDKHDVSREVRYVVWKNESLSNREFPRGFVLANRARSLLFRHRRLSYMSKSFLQGLISNFKHLRILSLADFEFEYLPNSIGDLQHLRYLCLARNPKLMALPNSVSKLVNLQTLDVVLCNQLQVFPTHMHRLASLRHLQFTSILATFPNSGFHGWTSIQHIMVADCTLLTSIPEQIGILVTLKSLKIISCPNLPCLPDSICHLINLTELKIFDCEKLNLVEWQGLQGLRSIEHLEIQNLPLLVHFPNGFEYVSGSIKYLIIKECQNLIALPESLKQCTCLLNLTLYDCINLPCLPSGIRAVKSLQELWVAECPLLNLRCQRDVGKDWPLISHIPLIHVDYHMI